MPPKREFSSYIKKKNHSGVAILEELFEQIDHDEFRNNSKQKPFVL